MKAVGNGVSPAVLAKKILIKGQLQALYFAMFIGRHLGRLGKFGVKWAEIDFTSIKCFGPIFRQSTTKKCSSN